MSRTPASFVHRTLRVPSLRIRRYVSSAAEGPVTLAYRHRILASSTSSSTSSTPGTATSNNTTKRIYVKRLRMDNDQLRITSLLDTLHASLFHTPTATSRRRRRRDIVGVPYQYMNALATHYGSSTTTTPTKRLFQKWWNSKTITINDIIAYFISLGRILLDPYYPPAIKGVYIYGDVGVGKSMIMDLFHATVVGTNMQQHQQQQNTTFVEPTSSSTSPVIPRRSSSITITSRRCHFHEFMIDIHTRIYKYKCQYPKSDPIPPIAASIASETTLLCLDEMQVTDIADAMILRRLFTILFKLNVILVTTSNRPPEKLYEGGINRASFVPFIDIIQDSMVVVGMNGVIDYRKEEEDVIDCNEDDDSTTTTTNTATTNSSLVVSTMSVLPRYICPSIEPSPTIRQQFINDWFTITSGGDTNNQSETIPVAMGRYIHITKSNTNCAILTFDEVCNRPLGAADYIALATRYEIIILTNVPQLDGHVYNQARRFVTFIDALYEAKTILILDANVNREELFVGFNACITTNDGDEEIALDDDNEDEHNNSSTKTIKNEEIVVMREGGSSSSSSTTFISCSDSSPNSKRGDDGRVEWSATGRIGVSLAQLSSVREVSFSFARADSRLAEMCTSSWGRYVNK
jgi:protein AFG1